MSAKVMNPRNRTSSLSKREKIRRYSLETAEQPFDLVASLVHLLVVLPGVTAGDLGRNHRQVSQIQGQLAGVLTLISAVHHQERLLGLHTQAAEQPPSVGSIVGLAGRQRKRHRRSSIRGNHMNLGGPPTPGLPNRLGSPFFRAPVPSGCTFTMVLSIHTASSRIRTICSRCNCSNTRSNTPFFDQRFIRVYTVCHLPNRAGSPLHLQPCSATYKIAFNTCRFETRTLPRCTGKQDDIRSYCS